MKIKNIEYSRKVGMPNYSSLSFGANAEVVDGEDLDEAVDKLKQFVDKHCSPDQGWIGSGNEELPSNIKVGKLEGK